jgi:hypothetical protein
VEYQAAAADFNRTCCLNPSSIIFDTVQL